MKNYSKLGIASFLVSFSGYCLADSDRPNFDLQSSELTMPFLSLDKSAWYKDVTFVLDINAGTFELVSGAPTEDPGAVIQPTPDPAPTRLTTMFRESFNECLEGNQVNGDINGAAFMNQCHDGVGQLWKMIPSGLEGYFRLTTVFRENEGECLEGNQVNGSLNGIAFMNECQNVSGQLWKMIPAEQQGYFKLTTLFRENEDGCLEGNQVNGDMGGGAFMAECQDVSGQLWTLK